MGNIKKHPPVKLIAGFIYSNDAALNKVKACLQKQFGKIDFESQKIAFIYTDYYQKEFGLNLLRSFISFKKLIYPENLPAIKIKTNQIEKKFSSANLRSINIDPGYLDLAKLVLATTKDYQHRIYLNGGIYAEITLFYQGKTFKHWNWTYPDYRTKEYIEIFNAIRQIYSQQIPLKLCL